MKSIRSLIAATLAAATLLWIVPAYKLSAADKKISDIFPDKNLQAWVKENVDTSGDGNLSQAEIDKVTEIKVSLLSISDMTGITVFKNLKKLDCSHNLLTDLDLAGLTALTEIKCNNNQLMYFNAKDSTKLEVLNCHANKLKQGMGYFNISRCILLKNVDVSDNEFTNFDWGNKRTQLETFDCSNNKIATLNISGVKALRTLDCSDNPLDSINISGLDNLTSLTCFNIKNVDISNSNVTTLRCGGTLLETLKLSGKLQTFYMKDNGNFKELDLRDCKGLKGITLQNNKIDSLNVSGLENLKYLFCNENELTKLTLGNNKALYECKCSGNKLKELKIDSNPHLLRCEDNQLEYLDISEASELREATNLMGYHGTNEEHQIYYGTVSGKTYEIYIDTGVKIYTDKIEDKPSNNGQGNNNQGGNNQGSGNVDPVGESGTLIRGFVKRLYTCVLGRDAETDGLNFWTNDLYNFKVTGAEVAQGFIFSQEFKDRKTSDEDFVKILYNTFFDREPETDGFNFWVGLLKSGTSRETVANGFIFSQEWADTCATYGIRSGCDIKSKVTITPTDRTYGFVERLYVKAFNRDFDAEGREYWANLLSNYSITGEQAGANFFLSKEMEDYHLSNEEFVNRLYATFMDREGEEDGVKYWVGVLAGGASRESVVYGFTRSPEFTEKCVVARILPY